MTRSVTVVALALAACGVGGVTGTGVAAADTSVPAPVLVPDGNFASPAVTDPSGREEGILPDPWSDYYGCGAALESAVADPALPAGVQLFSPTSACPSAYWGVGVATQSGVMYEVDYTVYERTGRPLTTEVQAGDGHRYDTLSGNTDAVARRSFTFTATGSTTNLNVYIDDQHSPDGNIQPGAGGITGITLARLAGPFYDAGPEAPPAGNLVVNGGFEQPALDWGKWGSFGSIDGWSQYNDCGVEVQNHAAGEPYRGQQFVELAGNCVGGVQQTVPVQPGHTYTLTYAFSARPGTADYQNDVQVLANGAVVDEESANPGSQTFWIEHAVTIPATTSSLDLAFVDTDQDSWDGVGSYLDSVSLVDTAPDTTPPTLTVPADSTTEATSSSGAPVSFSATATDDLDANPAVTCDHASGATFPVGATTVTCTAKDASGNVSAPGTFTVSVSDTTPPALSPTPTLDPFEATGPKGTVVTYSSPTATDVVDGTDAVTCDHPSGATFPLGTTTVTCSSADRAGNTGTVSFPITVHDTTAPVVNGIPGDVTVPATGPAGATVTYTSPTATDAVDGTDAVICSQASGSTFAVGSTQVTCTATDASGNAASATFRVKVSDLAPPTFSGVLTSTTVEATGPSGAAYAYTLPKAVGIVDGDRPVSCDVPSGAVLALGSHDITCTATDGNGTSATATWSVTVADNTPPVLHGMPSAMTLEATGPDGAALSYAAPTATDVVDGTDPVSCTTPSGTTVALGATTVTCTSTDKAGNAGQASFVVTVRDTTAPAITVPAPVTVAAVSPAGAPVTFAVTATDLVGGATPVTCTPASGSVFAIGTTTVSCTSADQQQNTATATFTVTVLGAADQATALVTTLQGLPASGLAAQGQAVQASIAAGRTTPAGGQLGALLNSTSAQVKSGRLTAAQGAAITRAVTALLGTLG